MAPNHMRLFFRCASLIDGVALHLMQGCVGKQLAMVEMKVLMACWLQSLSIARQPGVPSPCAQNAYSTI